MQEKFIIPDLDVFVDNLRKVVFSGFGKATEESPDEFTDLLCNLTPEEETELESVLTQQESKLIIEPMAKKQINKNTHKIRYIIDENIFGEMIESLNARLVSNILVNLTQKGMVESAYDDDLNDFVFWIKEDENKDNKS